MFEMRTAQEIIDEIIRYVRNQGGVFSEWYVGVASDPAQKLFESHGVNEYNWTYLPCGDEGTAQFIQSHLKNNLGFDGRDHEAGIKNPHIYVFRKGFHTKT